MKEEGRFRTLDVGESLWRVYPAGKSPLFFGPPAGKPPRNRFDAPDGSYGVCYTAHQPSGAFVETFLRDPEAAGRKTRILAASHLDAHDIIRVELQQPLTVARLRGPGLSWRGVTASVSSSPYCEQTWRLSSEIHSESRKPDGIEYRCRHNDDQLAVALFERSRPALSIDPSSGDSCLQLARRLEGAYPFVIDDDG